MTEPWNALVEGLFARHRTALQAFFFRRLRTKADAADLAQEVYLRILRVNDPDTIRNPQAYLFAVAGNLLKENAVADRRPATSVDVEEADALFFHLAVGQDLAAALRGGGLEIWQPGKLPLMAASQDSSFPGFRVAPRAPQRRGCRGAAASGHAHSAITRIRSRSRLFGVAGYSPPPA